MLERSSSSFQGAGWVEVRGREVIEWVGDSGGGFMLDFLFLGRVRLGIERCEVCEVFSVDVWR